MRHPTRPVPVEQVTIRHRDSMGLVFMAESTEHRISTNKTTRGKVAPSPGRFVEADATVSSPRG